jgi:hypothetical protein
VKAHHIFRFFLVAAPMEVALVENDPITPTNATLIVGATRRVAPTDSSWLFHPLFLLGRLHWCIGIPDVTDDHPFPVLPGAHR